MPTLKKITVVVPMILVFTGFLFATPVIGQGEIDVSDLNGDGTEANPYVITNVEELQAMNQDLTAHYVLGSNIDASDTTSWNGGQGFEPIGDRPVGGDRSETPFTGSFDGQGYTISNLYMDRAESGLGLFGANHGTIENVLIADADVRSSKSRIGIAVGENAGEMQRVFTTGTVESEDRLVGGLVGWAVDDGVIEQSGSSAIVIATEQAGGLTGSNRNNHQIRESYASGEVSASNRVGGFAGQVTNGAEIRNSYSSTTVNGGGMSGSFIGFVDGSLANVYTTGKVSASGDKVGGLAGVVGEGSGRNAYWDRVKSGKDSGSSNENIGSELTTDQMTGPDAEANMDLDFDEYWTVTDEYPILQWQVEAVSLEVAQPTIGEGESTSVDVVLTLHDGSTVTATEAADFDSEEAVAGVSNGRLEANAQGQTDLTATVAGETETVTIEVLEPPNIEFVEAAFDAEAAVAGTPLEATVTYENTGGPGSETATVTVDGEDVTAGTVRVDAGGETTRTLSWDAETSGTVTVAGETVGELTVVEPGNVTLESVTLPETAAAGSEYDIDLELSSDHDVAVLDTVQVRVGGDVVAEEVVEVPPGGGSATITSAHDEEGTTTHVIALHDQEETATMEILPPAEFALEGLETPESITEGETASVAVTVTNVGGGADEAEIALTVGGETVDTRSVSLAAEESTTLEFDAALEDAGDVEVGVASPDDEVQATLTVAELESGGDGIPGFTPVVAVVALGLAVLGFGVRRR